MTTTTVPTSYIADLKQHIGARVDVRGWLYNRRSSGKIHFLEVRDGTGIVQCVAFHKDVSKELFDFIPTVAYESSVRVRGSVRADDRSPGGVEMGLEELDVVSAPTDEYPIALKEHGIDFLLSQRHLWLRHKGPFAVMRVRNETIQAIRDFFYQRGFLNIDAPIFTPSACEGTTNLFEVKYFEDAAYLTQSGQLYMEAAAMAYGKVYCFGPCFRAEKSKTRRHLTEFWMVEPEVAYADLNDAMDLAEEFVRSIVRRVVERCGPELESLERDLSRLETVNGPFPRISYDEAVQLLNEKGHDFEWGNDFGSPEETAISEHFERPVLIHRYPKALKAFYMAPDPEDDRLALCVDMIAPEGVGEIIGGGQRADSLKYLEQQIAAHDLPKEAFEWFLDLRRYGSVPHAGFGLGLERTVAWLCGREHVRECIPFPRTLYRKYP